MGELWLQPVNGGSIRWAESQSSVLDEEETRRWQRYQTSENRALFLVAHVATRHVLAHSGDRRPESWRFDRGANGRPEILDGPAGLRFNISHTKGMVAVLVHGEADCGVDVEHPWRSMDMRSVARRVFTEDEQASIFSGAAEARADRFFQLWTLKEAFIKAKGKGFALPLQQFSFSIDDERAGDEPLIEFACDPALEASPEQWEFFTQRLETGHIVSLAADGGAGVSSMPVTIRQLNIGAD